MDYGWLDANYPGFGEDDSYDDESGDGGYGSDQGMSVESDEGQPQEEYGPPPAGYEQPPDGYAQPAVPYAQPAQEEPAQRQVAAPSLYDSDAVTLVFKDGRPPERIHNYALTRTTVYVTDGRRREIPVAALDLAATEKANREAGVSFQLPVAQ
jgi:hypothetical protein